MLEWSRVQTIGDKATTTRILASDACFDDRLKVRFASDLAECILGARTTEYGRLE